jgi:long-chain acyl-CoA synthetase
MGVTLATILERSYSRFASRTALVDGDRRLTYAELGDLAHRTAIALTDSGLEPGDRVVLLSGNRADFVVVEHALFVSGLVRVTPSVRLHAKEVAYIVNDCDARILVVEDNRVEDVRSILDEMGSVERVVVLGEAPEADRRFVALGDLLRSTGAKKRWEPPVAGDVASLLYTSGTTGSPKGATLTHANWVAMVRNSLTELPLVDEADVVLHVTPMSHLSGYLAIQYFARGAAHVVLRRFDLAETLRAIGEFGVTALPIVPTMLNRLVLEGEEGNYDLSSLRVVTYAGSPIAPDRLARGRKVFGDVLVQFYGLSETPIPLSALSPRDHAFEPGSPLPDRLSSAGRVNPFVELKIVGPDGKELPIGEVGEIMVRGDIVMAGYWGKPEKTAEMIDPEGWAATGDLGRLDRDGYLYVVDRMKDTIITGGYNVYPTEVENTISTLEAVQEVAVVGMPDERWGESVKAVVVPRPGHDLSVEDVVAVCRDNLADYKKPRSMEFVEELPKTGSGKVMRRKIRDRYLAEQRRRVGG